MAENLARIFGTEEDKVNCSFYFKIGACRHGDGCSRVHMKPNFSETLLVKHFYVPPGVQAMAPTSEEDTKEHYEDFFEEIYDELSKFGNIKTLCVCENLGDHMFGNTYVQYDSEDNCAKAFASLNGRYYGGRMLQAEYSPVTDFREARCRQFEEQTCARGGYCNFMHLKPIPVHMRKYFKRRVCSSNNLIFRFPIRCVL